MTRYLFVGGLHRSGTSILARLIAGHPDVAAIAGSPAPENEGCYLQGAIPHTALHGRPMHYATDPDQHHVEGGRYDNLEVRARLDADWSAWFDPSKTWRLEKSPVNLARMRLYQQLFPMCQFVVVIRHPEMVAAAVAKWVTAPSAALVDHWIAAHRRLLGDLPFLHSVCVLRYEDLCRDPAATVSGIHRFMDLPPASDTIEETIRNGNAEYAQVSGLAEDLCDWGYGPGGRVDPWTPIVRHPLRATRDAVVLALPGQ